MAFYCYHSFSIRPNDDVSASARVVGTAAWLGLHERDSVVAFLNTLFEGSTFEEVDAIAKAINAAISGAKSRALEAAIAAAAEPVQQAAE